MANYHINTFKIADQSDLDVYINGTTSLTELTVAMPSIGSISYDFSDVDEKLQGMVSLSFSNKGDVFDTYYSDLSTGLWIIHIDSVEYFRGVPDLNSFKFDRRSRSVSFNLFSGGLSEVGVDISGLTVYTQSSVDYISVSDLVDEVASSELGLTTSYDIQTTGTTSLDDYYFVSGDAGANDYFFTIRKLSNVTDNRVGNLFDLFGLRTSVWKNTLYIYEIDKYFSDTVTVNQSDTQSFIEYMSYKIKDYSYNTYVKLYYYEDFDSQLNMSGDNFITLSIDTAISGSWGATTGGDNSASTINGEISIQSFNDVAYFTLGSGDTQSLVSGEKIRILITYTADLYEWDVYGYVKVGDTFRPFQLTETPTAGTDTRVIEFDIGITSTSSNIELGYDRVESTDMVFEIDSISESASNIATIDIDSTEHGFAVGNLLRVNNTTNFNGTYEVTELNVGGSADVIKATKTIAGTPSLESSGQVYKNINVPKLDIINFAFIKIDSTTKVFTNGLNTANPTQLKQYDKGASILKDLDNQNYFKEVSTIYDDRLGNSSVKKLNIKIKQDNINPYSRLTIDSVNYLINKFKFDFVTKNKTIELIEE